MLKCVDSKLQDLSVPTVEYSIPACLTDVTDVKVCFSLICLQLVQVKWQKTTNDSDESTFLLLVTLNYVHS